MIETGKELIVSIGRVRPYEGQPRTYFDPKKLYQLSLSIKSRGQKKAIDVKAIESSEADYEIVDGERRWRACQLAGLKEVKIIIREINSAAEHFEESVISNFGREEHTKVEIARAVTRMKLEQKLTYEELADRFAKSTGWIHQHLTLSKLPVEVLDLLNPELPDEKQIRFVDALLLAKIDKPVLQIEAAWHIVNNQLTNPQVRLYVDKLCNQYGAKKQTYRQGNNRRDECRSLERFLKTLEAQSEYILNLKQRDFVLLLGHKNFFDVKDMVDSIDKSLNLLIQMEKLLKSVMETKGHLGKGNGEENGK